MLPEHDPESQGRSALAEPDNRFEHRLAGLRKLLEITRELAAETELDRILQIITDGVCDAIECERASLFLYDPRKRELYTRVATELEIREIRMPIGDGINGWVGRNHRLLNVPRPALDPRWNSSFDGLTGFRTRNILAAPLLSRGDGRLLGTLELLNSTRGSEFDCGDEQLLEAFAAHAAASLDRADLLDNLRKTRELEGSLEAARNVQQGFLPQCLPVIPGYEIAAWWQPALGVAGDYYDAVTLPDGQIALVIADVSGHGLAASLIMAAARAMLHVLLRTQSDPARILTLLGATITPDLQAGRFITILLGMLDPGLHLFRFSNGGHGPAFQLQRSDGACRELEPTNCPIGVIPDDYRESADPVRFEPGDLLVLATDGAIEQRNAQGQMFGRERFEALVRRHQALPAVQLLDRLKGEIQQFFTSAHPHDDITLLIVERKRR
jgi:serine phosphatase RsbU (regulator of sigma subunit)